MGSETLGDTSLGSFSVVLGSEGCAEGHYGPPKAAFCLETQKWGLKVARSDYMAARSLASQNGSTTNTHGQASRQMHVEGVVLEYPANNLVKRRPASNNDKKARMATWAGVYIRNGSSQNYLPLLSAPTASPMTIQGVDQTDIDSNLLQMVATKNMGQHVANEEHYLLVRRHRVSILQVRHIRECGVCFA